jgi:hypothetical protein
VIFSADSDIYTENLALILNSFDYLSVQVPEPSTIALAMLGGLAVVAAAIRRRR